MQRRFSLTNIRTTTCQRRRNAYRDKLWRQLGVRNTDVSYLDNWSSHFYSYGPSLSIPIFQGGQLVSSVKLARAQQAWLLQLSR